MGDWAAGEHQSDQAPKPQHQKLSGVTRHSQAQKPHRHKAPKPKISRESHVTPRHRSHQAHPSGVVMYPGAITLTSKPYRTKAGKPSATRFWVWIRLLRIRI